MSALISAHNISVIAQGEPVLDNVSLSVSENDFITIVGPNGAGKSLLLKCLIGVQKPSSGSLTRQEGLRIGYVPQKLVVEQILPLSAERFITLRQPKDASRELATIAEEVNISHILHRPLAVLSGGELQRVLLARSLLNNPSLLVLDEPAQNLDISGQLGFYKLLQKIYEERGLSILMVSHDLHMVMASSKQVVCLFRHVCCSGAPHAVAKDPEFISLFGKDMSDMIAVYQHSHDHSHDHDEASHA